jgi:hypothetical protein
MTTHRAKPVRPVWETGQAGFAWTVEKNIARGKNSTFEDHVWFEDRWMVASLCDE